MPRPILPRQSADDAVSLEERLRQLEARLALLERLPAGEQVQSTDFSPLPGQIVTVEAPPAGLGVLLPTPRPQIRNARISISSRNANPIRWQAVDGTVNGAALITSNAVGLVEAVCDGAAWHVSQGAASPTGSVASTAGATYFLETADTGLPNARVGTDSTEIDVDYTVASVVSWALKTASVAFSKLANLTGLSVLGRAANSSGVMAAITATAERQALMSDSDGTSLGWRAPEIADLADVDADSFLGNITSSPGAVTANSLATLAGNFLTYAGSGVINWDGVLVSQGPTGIGTFRSLDFVDGTNTTAAVGDVGGGVAAVTFNVDLSSVTYTAGDGLTLASNEFSVDAPAIAGGGLIGFGSVLSVVGGDGIDVAADSVAVNVSDFAGTGLEDDGSNNLRIAASAAGNGLTGGGGSALAVGGSTSIIVGANDVQRAALTSEVTAAQNSNSCTVTRSTNFQSSPWTGQHQHNDNVYHSGFIGIGAKATVDAYALGDIRSAGDLDILASATGTASLIAGTAILRNGLFTAAVQCDDDGVRLSAPGSGDLVDIWANSVRIASGLAGTGAGFLRIVESGSSVISLSAGEGMHWVRSDAPNVPMFTDDTNVDHEIAYPLDDDGKDARTWARCVFWDDFCSVEGATFGGGAFGAITCDTGWIVTNNSLTGTATITQVDGGTGGPSNAPGQLQISTSSTTGTQIDLTKGNNNTCRWLRASDVKSLKFRLAIPTTTSVHVTFGLNDGSFGSTDCARFDYDSSVDTTLHAISNSAAGVASNTDINVTPGTAMHSYEIRSPSASSLDWEFYRDGSLVATQTVGSKSRGVNVHISIANLTASDRTIRVDYVSLETWELSR